MTLQDLIKWRRKEKRRIHGEDPDSGEDSASAEEKSSERDVPPERAQQHAADIIQGDPFQNITEEKLAAW